MTQPLKCVGKAELGLHEVLEPVCAQRRIGADHQSATGAPRRLDRVTQQDLNVVRTLETHIDDRHRTLRRETREER